MKKNSNFEDFKLMSSIFHQLTYYFSLSDKNLNYMLKFNDEEMKMTFS